MRFSVDGTNLRISATLAIDESDSCGAAGILANGRGGKSEDGKNETHFEIGA